MQLKDVINSRKSIRSYEKKIVPKTVLKQLVIDASKAPSASNRQPWRFYVVSSKKLRDKICNILQKTLIKYKADFDKLTPKLKKVASEFYTNMGDCQNIIFIYSNSNDKKGRESNYISISAAMENLMLSATNKGLGTCCVGSFKEFEKEISKLLKTKNKEELVVSILVGYPKKGWKPLKRKKKKITEILNYV